MPEANVPGYANAVTQGPRRGLLWTQLRESTRAAHAQAEASLAPLAQPDSLARYVALLCVLWGFQAPLERLLAHQELPSAVDWPARQRLGALAADLTDLGVTGRVAARSGRVARAGRSRCGVGHAVRYRRGYPGRPGTAASASKPASVPFRPGFSTGTATAPSRCGVTWAGLPTCTSRAKQDRQLARQTAIQAFAAFSTWASQRIGDTVETRPQPPPSPHPHHPVCPRKSMNVAFYPKESITIDATFIGFAPRHPSPRGTGARAGPVPARQVPAGTGGGGRAGTGTMTTRGKMG